jgi:glycosyltransferase involved in cell wall biosynthesis
MSHADEHPKRLISIVIPVFNEEDVLPVFLERLASACSRLDFPFEWVFVDDGSDDGTGAKLAAARRGNDHVGVLRLSRNFGKEVAISAGLQQAVGDAVVIIDADLQDPPELIPALVAHWLEGFDNVFARRTDRGGDGPFKRWTAHAFYRLLGRVTNIEVPADAGDFRLLDRRAVDAILQFREQHRFMKGLYAWVGYRAIAVPYERDPRAGGATKWSYRRLWNLAIDGITSFTVAPLKLASLFGLAVAVLALVYGAIVIVKTLLFGDHVQGYPSLMVVVLFLGGIQLLFLGIVGEYLGRVFNEVKGRPLYLVDELHPSRFARERSGRGADGRLPEHDRGAGGDRKTAPIGGTARQDSDD